MFFDYVVYIRNLESRILQLLRHAGRDCVYAGADPIGLVRIRVLREAGRCVFRIAENLPVVLGYIEVFDQFVGEPLVLRRYRKQFKDMRRWRL